MSAEELIPCTRRREIIGRRALRDPDRRIAFGLTWVLLAGLSCSGPQPLSIAIRPADDREYLRRLNAENGDGRKAFLEWMAEERSTDIATIQQQDLALSSTRNPFNARKNHVSVGLGAVFFKYHCARCHGEDARGKGPSVLTGHPANDFHSFANRFASTVHGGAPRRWFKSISEGFGDVVKYPDDTGPAMPAFGGTLAREQIWLVITYLQSLDVYAPKGTTGSHDSSNDAAHMQSNETHRVTP